jgi:hypothetical protein
MYPFVHLFSHVVYQEAAYITKQTNPTMWNHFREKADFNGSSLATMVGLSRCTSRKQFWREKISGLREEPTKEAKDRINFGEDNESWGMEELKRRWNNNNSIFWSTGTWTVHTDIKGKQYILAATPDGLITAADDPLKERMVIEIKMRKYDPHFPEDELPPDWYIQVQMEMRATMTKEAVLWCYSGYSNDFRGWKILEDKDTLDQVLEQATKFLEEVQTKEYSNFPSKDLRDRVETAIRQYSTCVFKDLPPLHPELIEWNGL